MSTTTLKETLVIKSSEWLRCPKGNKNFSSGMFRQGRYCCLGLDARREGATDKELACWASPHGLLVDGVIPSKAYENRWLNCWGSSSELAKAAMHINDNPATTDEEKIASLRDIFAQVGIGIDWRPNE